MNSSLILHFRRARATVSLLIFLLPAVRCVAQGTLSVRFEGPPPQPPGTAYYVQEYFEAGLWFRPIGVVGPGNGFGRVGAGSSKRPDNGSSYLQAALGDSLVFSFTDGSLFGIASVDLAGYSDIVPDFAVEFVGYRSVGGTVATSFSGSGISFQTFHFGPEFSDLIRVEIPTYGWSLDNLTVSVPEPTLWSILLLGGGLLFREQRRGKGKARAIPVSNQNDHQ